ncbi:MAG: hypothetical protein V7K77_13860 [Nostoc sp.]|uniref:hypothetical protein n=1 Tax=Nostoc sp. TaxID=1180 RepID=UPI002FF9B555
MSGMYGAADENESIATIQASLDRGSFSKENLAQNQRPIEELKQIAAEKGVLPSQLAILGYLRKAEILCQSSAHASAPNFPNR